jgi:hypothetical protein
MIWKERKKTKKTPPLFFFAVSDKPNATTIGSVVIEKKVWGTVFHANGEQRDSLVRKLGCPNVPSG